MSTPPPTEARSDERAPTPPSAGSVGDELRLWQRFHIRLTVLHGAIVLLTIFLMGAFVSHRVVQGEMNRLKGRLLTGATTLSHVITPETVRELSAEGADATTPAYSRLVASFEAIARDNREISSIYVLRPSGERGWLLFCADYMPNGEQAAVGQRYDATQAPVMLSAFDGPIVEKDIYVDEWGPTLSAYAPIRDEQGTALAIVGCDMTAATVVAARRQVLALSMGLLAAVAVVMALVSWAVGQNVRKPLSRIIEATSAMARGEFNVRSSLARSDEFGVLGRHVDQMAEGLEEREFIRETFGKYVSPEVARRALDGTRDGLRLGGELREVTVLFNDIRGYSTISEALSPTQIVDVLNTYLGAASDLVDQHQGCVIEFLGDSLFAIFGAPNALPDHAERAVRCALAIRARIEELNAGWEASGVADLWRQRGIERLSCRSGLHSGIVVAGNLGSGSRLKYGVLGDPVNVAARVEALNKELGTDLLVTTETWLRLPPDLKALARPAGSHAVKGRQQSVTVHAL